MSSKRLPFMFHLLIVIIISFPKLLFNVKSGSIWKNYNLMMLDVLKMKLCCGKTILSSLHNGLK